MAQRRADRRGADRRSSEERWAAIVDAGSEVFRRLGFSQATLEDVAREVGINRATLYYYVADKEELLIAILDEPIHRMTSDLRAIAALDESPTEKVRRAINQHMRTLEENYPGLFVFLAENLHLLTVGSDRDIQANAHEYGEVMIGLIEEGIATGDFRTDLDPRLVMLGIIGMLNWTHRWYTPDGKRTLGEIGEEFAALVLQGLARHPG
jgi:TetR/AcrR family transcriptional regulator, cholesterol catabolism regulator